MNVLKNALERKKTTTQKTHKLDEDHGKAVSRPCALRPYERSENTYQRTVGISASCPKTRRMTTPQRMAGPHHSETKSERPYLMGGQ